MKTKHTTYYRQVIKDLVELVFNDEFPKDKIAWGVYRIYYIPTVSTETPFGVVPGLIVTSTQLANLRARGWTWIGDLDSGPHKVQTVDVILAWPKGQRKVYYPSIVGALGKDVPIPASSLNRAFFRALHYATQAWIKYPAKVAL